MRVPTLAAVIVALSVSAGVSAKIYKWVDDEGQVHYGQQAPSGAEIEQLDVRGAPPSADESGEQDAQQQTPSDQPDDGTSGSEDEDSQGMSEDEVIAKNCRVARQNLDILERAGPGGRFRQPDGEVVRYDEEDWQSRVEKNKTYIDEHCQDQ